LKIGIVVGSHRHDSQSRKVALYLEQQLQSLNAETWLHDLAHDPLPLWDENLGSGEGPWAFLPDLVEQLQSSDGFVIVSPEWHGMATSAVKNFFLLCNVQSGLAHKPALITAISGGDGGAYVVSELRASSYKNNRLCYIPEQLVVRNVGKVFNADSAENDPEAHTYFVDRADYSLKLLLAYSEALGALRGGGVVDLDGYPNGM
tara:strand:- start:139 stop:747 length:609 start_codon:yes stop_codon:yes gene_type:complete